MSITSANTFLSKWKKAFHRKRTEKYLPAFSALFIDLQYNPTFAPKIFLLLPGSLSRRLHIF